MSVARIAKNTMYRFPKPDLLSKEGAKLPEAYKSFYREWKLTQPSPVHYTPPASKWVRNEETGEVKRVADVPIPLKYVPESHKGIWGGEAVIKGFKKNAPNMRVPHFWFPHLVKSVVYSEVLDKRMEVTVTPRTIDLIIDHHGFDNYLLNSKACDLQSSLALKIKRRILHALFHKTLYPNDPIKKDSIYAKYQHFLEPYTAEDIEWYGFTFDEALRKFEQEEAAKVVAAPLKHELRLKYIEFLTEEKNKEPEERVENDSSSWVSKLNPFTKKS